MEKTMAMLRKRTFWVGVVAVLAAAVGLRFTLAQSDLTDWVTKGEDWPARKQQLQAYGERFKTSDELYQHLRDAAGGGKALTWSQMGEPAYDWSGVYTRTGGGLEFDMDLAGRPAAKDFLEQVANGKATLATAQLTPAGQKVVQAKAKQLATTGGEYDPISDCRPPGVPRWLTEPFLHEYVVTPNQTWLINEMVNDVRRVYTDGREHTPVEDAYPSWNGDTIGFWHQGVLVTHTRYLMQGQYQRGLQPDYSDQTTVVERWHKVDERTLQADVWVYDPLNLKAPWYTRQSWTRLSNDDKALRLRYWDCRENSNNLIDKKDDGTSEFKPFDFEKPSTGQGK
jgi:hypothetical protein